MTVRQSGLVVAILLALCHPFRIHGEEQPAPGYSQSWKLTLGLYRTGGETSGDLNLRGTRGDFNFWLAGYAADGTTVGRIGGEWAYRSESLRFTPTVAFATNGLVAGQLYGEIGGSVYLIAGVSRTNLRDYFNLTFDPNESVQLGAGARIDPRTLLNAYSIFDVRLGTGQQNTHVVFRRYLVHEHRLTLDLVYKTGHTGEGDFVRGVGLTATWDWASYFVRAAYDPYANFSNDTMVRLGGGVRF